MLGQFGPQQNQSKYAKKMGDFALEKANEAQQKTEELEAVIDENRFNFKGEVTTRSAIPSSKSFGDAWFILDEGRTVRWNGTTLENRNTNNPSQIQNLTEQLADTIKKNEPSSVSWAMADQNFREQVLGNTPPAVVGVDSVLRPNIVRGAVTPDRTSFLVTGKNKYNPTDVYVDTILSSSGVPSYNATHNTIDYIPVELNKGLWLSINDGTPLTGYRVVLYDSAYNVIQVLSSFVNGTPITNASAAYLRISVTKKNLNNFFQLEFGDNITFYQAYNAILKDNVKRAQGTNRDIEMKKSLTHNTDTRSLAINRVGGRVSLIHEVDGAKTLKTTSIEYDSNGNVISFTESAEGVSIKTNVNRTSGVITGITKEVI